MKIEVPLNKRRFLIVWMCIQVVALVVNLVPIEGRSINGTHSYYYWTYKSDNKEGDFWPFTKFTSTYTGYVVSSKYRNNHDVSTPVNVNTALAVPAGALEKVERSYFYGIFNNYGVGEFIVYVLLGLGIVFIPMLWGES